jgi:hypothetical protein
MILKRVEYMRNQRKKLFKIFSEINGNDDILIYLTFQSSVLDFCSLNYIKKSLEVRTCKNKKEDLPSLQEAYRNVTIFLKNIEHRDFSEHQYCLHCQSPSRVKCRLML